MSESPQVNFSRPNDDTLLVKLSGSWTIEHGLPKVDGFQKEAASAPRLRQVAFDARELSDWDSGLLTFLIKIMEHCAAGGIETVKEGLPEGVTRLLALASAVPEQKGARKVAVRPSFLSRVGASFIGLGASAVEMLAFLGEASLACVNLVRGKARFQRRDLVVLIQECGVQALPIVSLISVLVGLILAFVGAVQLRLFGAQIYVADLVGLGMAREMGAMMTAVVMAGRTGAAFAAQLGTMEVNEEIDALKTLGISPMEFLVLPRMLALVTMLPLLALYADFMGILGGGIVGVGMLQIPVFQYYHETKEAIRLMDFMAGIMKSVVFGVLVALSGCLRGMQCGRSASAVGMAATSAVVTAIVAIIVSDAVLTVIYDLLGV